jgi:hypothetical protein
MGLRSTIGLTGSMSVILVIAILVISVIYLHKKYKEIFSIDYLWDNNYCIVVDENGKTVVDKDTGSIFGRNGIYSTEYCAFHPLMLTDSEFREKALALYDTSKMFTSIKNFFNGTWRLPDQNLIKADPILSTMILNPWYTSDDVFYTQNTIQYTFDLKTFIVDGKAFFSFDNDGLYSSFYRENINANKDTKTKCSPKDTFVCEDSPGLCNCQYEDVEVYYLYMDNRILIELPMQLYLGQIPDSQTKKIEIKVSGKKQEANIEPFRVTKLEDLEDLLTKRFYQFKDKIKTNCDLVSSKDQKAYDSECKFFQSDALAGLVIALKRIIIINIPESVRDAWIKKVDDKINMDTSLSYLEFFLWLAAKSHRYQITYNFQAFNKDKR